jgi:hypothetical protein
VHAGAKETAWRNELSKANQQVLDSQQKLLKLKAKTQEQVTSVKVAADQSESTHRQKEEALRQVRHMSRLVPLSRWVPYTEGLLARPAASGLEIIVLAVLHAILTYCRPTLQVVVIQSRKLTPCRTITSIRLAL